jgi:RNA polymerase sigma-54 factor
MQNTPASYHSLGDAVLDELAQVGFGERRHAIAEYLAYSLDPRGFLIEPLELLAAECDVEGATVEELAAVLADMRATTHPALGARDLAECLELQLDPDDPLSPLVRQLIREHMADITFNRLPRIARVTGKTLEEIKLAIDVLRGLDPFPAREYGSGSAENIHPDVIVEEVDGRYEVRLTREGLPNLYISPAYKKMLREARRGDQLRTWVRSRIESARWFLDALQQRQGTLLRISRAIFDRQAAFLDQGAKGLKPLKMVEIAAATGVHISTVSRAVSGKYVQTPQGIVPLRSFFGGGTQKDSGELASQAAIKERIRDLVAKEDPASPLSDDRLAEILKQSDGIEIARRTITKYRKALSIPSSTQRKQF